jgi:hypothetical protein
MGKRDLELVRLESVFDEKFRTLKIWELSFQTIYSCLLLTAEDLALNGKLDTSFDFLSRISLIYKDLLKLSRSEPIVNSSIAILKLRDDYFEDINYIVSYSHLCQLMPQVHKNMMLEVNVVGKEITLGYPNDETFKAEVLDRVYSNLSLPSFIEFNPSVEIQSQIDQKVLNGKESIDGFDFYVIALIKEFYIEHSIHTEVVNDYILENYLGFTNEDFINFTCSLRAFGRYSIILARTYKKAVLKVSSKEKKEFHMNEYFEWSVCCLNYKALGWFKALSGLSRDKFDLLLKYFIDVVSNETNESIPSMVYGEDGFLVPIVMLEQSIIFSPHSLSSMLSFNNILSSINVKDKSLFDNHISGAMEPNLIQDLEDEIAKYPTLKCKANILFDGGEIDLVVFDIVSNTCLVIQVKTTIAPNGARSVHRVQDRIIEAKKQSDFFESFDQNKKFEILRKSIISIKPDASMVSLIIMSSSAGTTEGWSVNKSIPLINKVLFKYLLYQDSNLLHFRNRIHTLQDQLIDQKFFDKQTSELVIGDNLIKFPNINVNNPTLYKFIFHESTFYSKK